MSTKKTKVIKNGKKKTIRRGGWWNRGMSIDNDLIERIKRDLNKLIIAYDIIIDDDKNTYINKTESNNNFHETDANIKKNLIKLLVNLNSFNLKNKDINLLIQSLLLLFAPNTVTASVKYIRPDNIDEIKYKIYKLKLQNNNIFYRNDTTLYSNITLDKSINDLEDFYKNNFIESDNSYLTQRSE